MKEENDDLFEFLGSLSKAIKETEEKYVFEHNFSFPMEITGIKKAYNFVSEDLHCKTGSLVKVRPCGEEYQGKTYIGIFLGNLAIDNICYLNKQTKELEIFPHTNPAIFVPELKKIVFGCESWWGKINSIEEIKDITDEDIENLWYVKLLKNIEEGKKNKAGGEKHEEQRNCGQ
jgi:hypothetical protein